MKIRSLVVVLGLLACCEPASPSRAASLQLSIIGTAFGIPVNETIDVSHGFPGATIPLTDSPLGVIFPSIREGQTLSTPSSISLEATLFDPTHNLASVDLSGVIGGELYHPIGTPNVNGAVGGPATSRIFRAFPGVEPSSISEWLPGLSAEVSGYVTSGGENLLQSSLSIDPGMPPPAQVVPESTTLAILVAGAGVARGLRGRRRV